MEKSNREIQQCRFGIQLTLNSQFSILNLRATAMNSTECVIQRSSTQRIDQLLVALRAQHTTQIEFEYKFCIEKLTSQFAITLESNNRRSRRERERANKKMKNSLVCIIWTSQAWTKARAQHWFSLFVYFDCKTCKCTMKLSIVR